jgi:hypothetical protein
MNGTLNSSTFRLVVQCIHDFVSGVLKIGEVIADHLVQCLRGFRPDDIDHAMHAPAVEERHGDAEFRSNVRIFWRSLSGP